MLWEKLQVFGKQSPETPPRTLYITAWQCWSGSRQPSRWQWNFGDRNKTTYHFRLSSGSLVADEKIHNNLQHFAANICHLCNMDVSLIHSFYSASALLAMQSAVLARGILSVRPSVLPSRSGIVSRRMKIRSCGLQHLVGQSL